jgi:hypothetical protein
MLTATYEKYPTEEAKKRLKNRYTKLKDFIKMTKEYFPDSTRSGRQRHT